MGRRRKGKSRGHVGDKSGYLLPMPGELILLWSVMTKHSWLGFGMQRGPGSKSRSHTSMYDSVCVDGMDLSVRYVGIISASIHSVRILLCQCTHTPARARTHTHTHTHILIVIVIPFEDREPTDSTLFRLKYVNELSFTIQSETRK